MRVGIFYPIPREDSARQAQVLLLIAVVIHAVPSPHRP
jgi:hypothetical protein